jgi:glycosyltransferase involved in cell wall biosynthesis
MKDLLVTIGMTCFNAEDTIGKAIDAALDQDWEKLEIVIVDDCSSDSSIKILEEKTKNDSRVKLVKHEKNMGYPSALNSIIKNANGEFISFFDDDDISVPNRLKKQYERITAYETSKNTDLVLCYSNRDICMGNPKEVIDRVLAIGRKPVEPYGEMVSDFILWLYKSPGYVWGQFGSCTMMARKSVFERIGGFDTQFRRSAEWDLAVRCGFMGGHFIAVDEPLIRMIKTYTPDKEGNVPLKYGLLLRKKYKSYLKKKKVYWASIALTHTRFHYAKGRRWKSRFYYFWACLCSPLIVGKNEIITRLGTVKNFV